MASATEVAASFGYSVTFFNSDPELKKLLSTAVHNNWTTDQFVAKFRATRWYKRHGEAFREIQVLKTSDPATYRQRLSTASAGILQLGYEMGAHFDTKTLHDLAEQSLVGAWSSEQIKAAIGRYVKTIGGNYTGNAATVQRQLMSMLGDYGYKPSTKQLGTWVSNIVTGRASLEAVQQAVINSTASKFPALKDRLMAGETLDDIAAPYKDSYARILEVNPQTINLTDPTLMKALQAKDAKGKPTTQTVWQFEQDLRKDKRWLSTKNAQDSLMGQTHELLQNFGLSAI